MNPQGKTLQGGFPKILLLVFSVTVRGGRTYTEVIIYWTILKMFLHFPSKIAWLRTFQIIHIIWKGSIKRCELLDSFPNQPFNMSPRETYSEQAGRLKWLHTCSAIVFQTVQMEKRCSSVSSSAQQRTQIPGPNLPLFCKFCQVRILFRRAN